MNIMAPTDGSYHAQAEIPLASVLVVIMPLQKR